MVGKADFRQADGEGAGRVFGGLPAGMAAKRRVHVIVGWPRHKATVERRRRKVE
jgi:hypothetical protein